MRVGDLGRQGRPPSPEDRREFATITTFQRLTFEKRERGRGLLTIETRPKGDLMASDRKRRSESVEKRRRHGYRGYGSPLSRVREDHDGDFHWELGFAGLGPGRRRRVLPHASVIPTASAKISRRRRASRALQGGRRAGAHLDAVVVREPCARSSAGSSCAGRNERVPELRPDRRRRTASRQSSPRPASARIQQGSRRSSVGHDRYSAALGVSGV
jgi:hypothetical protein